MWEFDHKESWELKNLCFWTLVWRRLLRVPWTARISDQSILKEIDPENSLDEWMMLKLMLKLFNWCWSWNSNPLATWCKELTHWKKPWCWERLKAGGKGDDRGWDSLISLPTPWTWVSASSWSWWQTGKPGLLQSKRLQRVGHDWETELNWIKYYSAELNWT